MKDKIFAGEIGEKLIDPAARPEDLNPVVVSTGHTNRTVGRNKSGCLWKKSTSARSGVTSKSALNRKSFAARMDDKKKRQSLQLRIDELR